MRFYWLVIGALAVWRITHLLYGEDGPWNLFVRLRLRAGVFGKLLDCFYCLSLWVAMPLAFVIGENWPERLLLWPALSAGASLVERSTASKADAQTLQYFEAEEEHHGLLRRYEATYSGQRPASDAGSTVGDSGSGSAPGSVGR